MQLLSFLNEKVYLYQLIKDVSFCSLQNDQSRGLFGPAQKKKREAYLDLMSKPVMQGVQTPDW